MVVFRLIFFINEVTCVANCGYSKEFPPLIIPNVYIAPNPKTSNYYVGVKI